MWKYVALIAFLASSGAMAQSGKIRICRAVDAPHSPHWESVTLQGGVSFNSNLNPGEINAGLMTVPKNFVASRDTTHDRQEACILTTGVFSAASASDKVPTKGSFWYRTVIDESVVVPVTAEALEDFARPTQAKIRICRRAGLTEIGDQKVIPLPAGSSFTNSGPINDFVVATVADAKLNPKPACTVVTAEIKSNFSGRRVSRSVGKLVAQFSPGATLEALVLEEFK